jgi:hypothetical protein
MMSVRKYDGRKEERKENGRARRRHEHDKDKRGLERMGYSTGSGGQSPLGRGERGFVPRVGVHAQPCPKGGETSERWLRRVSRTVRQPAGTLGPGTRGD